MRQVSNVFRHLMLIIGHAMAPPALTQDSRPCGSGAELYEGPDLGTSVELGHDVASFGLHPALDGYWALPACRAITQHGIGCGLGRAGAAAKGAQIGADRTIVRQFVRIAQRDHAGADVAGN